MSRPRTPPARPGGPAGTAPWTQPAPGSPSPPPARAGGTAPPPPAPGPGGELILGIADAASWLGYDKPDSFRRARTRYPFPGEGKMSDGRPCWTPAALQSWQSKRKIAGNRTLAGESD